MSEKNAKTGAAKSGGSRAERLKEALRENLRRRKAQARGRGVQQAERTNCPPGGKNR